MDAKMMEELAEGCEHAARVLWQEARNPDHSWDRPTCLRVSEGLSRAAADLRAHDQATRDKGGV